MWKIQYIICFFILFTSSRLNALLEDPWSSLSEKQKASLQEGKEVLVTEKIQESSWPYFHVYCLIKATPLQAAAIFWDVEKAPEYIPHCLRALLHARPSLNVLEVNYELEIPIFPNEFSRVRNTLHAFPHEGAYEISWEILSSRYSKSGRGSFLVLPHERGTLLCYSNFINPGSLIAPLLRAQAEKKVQETVSVLLHHIEEEVQENSDELPMQEKKLQEALGK